MLTIVIQAGGQSRRMGQDKALLPFLGQPLISRVVRRLSPIADEVLITTNKPEEYKFLKLPLFSDLIPNRGALGGLHTALKAARCPYVAVVACDMPFINPKLLSAQYDLLVDRKADIVIPKLAGGLEPFHAIYRRDACLPHIAAAIQDDEWRVDSWFHKVNLLSFTQDMIVQYDPQLLSFRNVNTPKELEGAIQLARKLRSSSKQ